MIAGALAAARAVTRPPSAPVSAGSTTYPDVVALPDGFYHEGIAVGTGHDVNARSLANGAHLGSQAMAPGAREGRGGDDQRP